MKKISFLLCIALATLSLTTSCDDYLDTLPDDRAEVDNLDKAASLLVTAYSTQSPNFIMEMSSDNVLDNGRLYNAQIIQEEAYRWQDVTVTYNDSPRSVWNNAYVAIGTANEVLASLEKLPDSEKLQAIKAEALLCRAFAMFRLSNMFCMAYDPTKADKYLGLPYPKEPGVTVPTRGTLKQLYENISADIEAALPKVSDAHLKVPKYHFNTTAAYAFAARFNLFYHNYDKAIAYADKALGVAPTFRAVDTYKSLGGVDEIGNAYVRSGDKANLLLMTAFSSSGRAMWHPRFIRFNHGLPIVSNETFWAKMPWGSSSDDNTLYESHLLYGSSQQVNYPKMQEMFEVTDKVNQTGLAHTIDAVFTTEETLLVRAEAYAMKKNFGGAIADINTWITAHCAPQTKKAIRPVLTEKSINDFWGDNKVTPVVPDTIKTDRDRGVKKPLHPQGFKVEKGTQTNLIYMILQMRRLETWQQGQRFQDIKRYGLVICHNIDGENPLIFKSGDLRGAIQLPADVISAGLEPNPRENTNEKK